MIEQIGIKLTSLISPIVPCYLSEAKTDKYPYAVYDHQITERRTKNGVYRFISDAVIDIFSKDFNDADRICGLIRGALEELNDAQFTILFKSQEKICSEEVWNISLNYRIYQNK